MTRDPTAMMAQFLDRIATFTPGELAAWQDGYDKHEAESDKCGPGCMGRDTRELTVDREGYRQIEREAFTDGFEANHLVLKQFAKDTTIAFETLTEGNLKEFKP